MLKHFAISQRGKSHIENGTNCQDFSKTMEVTNKNTGEKIVIAAIADGLGSCDFSEDGSRIAVMTALEYLSTRLLEQEDLSSAVIGVMLRKAFSLANQAIQTEADTRELPFLLFDTTLTIALVFEDGTCFFGHIGDDGMVALFTDGTYSMVTQRLEGEMSNSVFPLSRTSNWVFGKTIKPVAALMLMTDGVLDIAVGSSKFRNRVYYPFFKPAFENPMDSDDSVQEMKAFWDQYLQSDSFRNHVSDDITIVLVQQIELLKEVKPVPFDEDKWNNETTEFNKRVEEALTRKRPPEQKPDEATMGDDPAGHQEAPSLQRVDNAAPKPLRTENEPRDPFASFKNPHIAKPAERPASTQNSRDIPFSEPKDENKGRMSPPQSSDNKSKCKDLLHSLKKKLHLPLVVISLCLLGVATISSGSHQKRYKSGYLAGEKDAYSSGYLAGKQDSQTSNIRSVTDQLGVQHWKSYETGRFDAIAAFSTATSQPMETPAVNRTVAPEKSSMVDFPIDVFPIEKGTHREPVFTIQESLCEKGWEIDCDGIYGNKTQKAVRQFQQLNLLEPTGVVDLQTYQALLSESSKGLN